MSVELSPKRLNTQESFQSVESRVVESGRFGDDVALSRNDRAAGALALPSAWSARPRGMRAHYCHAPRAVCPRMVLIADMLIEKKVSDSPRPTEYRTCTIRFS